MGMELVKENIECEQLLGENTVDTVVKGDFVIPDTEPDVHEILMVDAKPVILSKEILPDKIFMEGQIEYTLLYLAKEENKGNVYKVVYSSKFSNYIQMNGADHKMMLDGDCYIEHMECNILNERKIAIETILKLKSTVFRKYDFQIIKDVAVTDDMQMLKNPAIIDKIVGNAEGDLIVKSHIQIPNSKAAIGSVLKCDVNVNRREVRLFDGKVQFQANANVRALYKAKDSRELIFVEDNIPVEKEIEFAGVNQSMENITEFIVNALEFNVKEDDLGENRILDVEALIKANSRIMFKEEIDRIEDAYSPSMNVKLEKKTYELNVMHGQNSIQTLVKEDIEIGDNKQRPISIIAYTSKACITDKKMLEDKVALEGVLNINVLYKTADEDRYVSSVNEEIPFACNVEIPGSKIDMQCFAKVVVENMDVSVQANTIAIKGLLDVNARVNYSTNKEFLVNIEPQEGEVPSKKHSLTIYVVQQGDTLWKIAKKYFTTIENLIKVNSIDIPEVIKPGQKLIIPGKAIM